MNKRDAAITNRNYPAVISGLFDAIRKAIRKLQRITLIKASCGSGVDRIETENR
ncbi:hypothetical protein N9H39_01120 [Gammaproteobacteria bacterium]|nr:hypothetical protein [Gammaproteobacteria bacterium]